MAKSRSFPALTDKARYHRSQTSKAMKKLARQLRCPHCERGMALKVCRLESVTVKTCRYCGFVREIAYPSMKVTDTIPAARR